MKGGGWSERCGLRSKKTNKQKQNNTNKCTNKQGKRSNRSLERLAPCKMLVRDGWLLSSALIRFLIEHSASSVGDGLEGAWWVCKLDSMCCVRIQCELCVSLHLPCVPVCLHTIIDHRAVWRLLPPHTVFGPRPA